MEEEIVQMAKSHTASLVSNSNNMVIALLDYIVDIRKENETDESNIKYTFYIRIKRNPINGHDSLIGHFVLKY